MELSTVTIENPESLNLILGQSHFIKTVEDLHEVMVAMGKADITFRYSGTDDELVELAKSNAYALAAGHCFIVFMRDMFPLNVLNGIKAIPEVCRIFCATANPVQVVIAETDQGRGIMGVIDGFSSKGIESEADILKRKEFLRVIGYKG